MQSNTITKSHMRVCIARVNNRYILAKDFQPHISTPFFLDFQNRPDAVVPGHMSPPPASCQLPATKPWLETIRLAKPLRAQHTSPPGEGGSTNPTVKTGRKFGKSSGTQVVFFLLVGDMIYVMLLSRPLNTKQNPKCGLKWLGGFNKIYWIPQQVATYTNISQ